MPLYAENYIARENDTVAQFDVTPWNMDKIANREQLRQVATETVIKPTARSSYVLLNWGELRDATKNTTSGRMVRE